MFIYKGFDNNWHDFYFVSQFNFNITGIYFIQFKRSNKSYPEPVWILSKDVLKTSNKCEDKAEESVINYIVENLSTLSSEKFENAIQLYKSMQFAYEKSKCEAKNKNVDKLLKNVTFNGFGILKVFFNEDKGTTFVLWDDGTKTKATCAPDDVFDKEKGLAICFMKKALGNNATNLNTILRKFCD